MHSSPVRESIFCAKLVYFSLWLLLLNLGSSLFVNILLKKIGMLDSLNALISFTMIFLLSAIYIP